MSQSQSLENSPLAAFEPMNMQHRVRELLVQNGNNYSIGCDCCKYTHERKKDIGIEEIIMNFSISLQRSRDIE